MPRTCGDPRAVKEFYPRTTDVQTLTFKRSGTRHNVTNRYKAEWSFKAVD